MTHEILINSVSFTNNWIRVIIMWYLTLLIMRGIINKSIRRPLLCLLLVPVPLNHWNPFSMICLTISFARLLFQHILMNVEDVVSQAILIKIVQSPKLINQLRFRRLSSSLMISSLIKILRHNIPAAVIIMVSQKMIWTFQKIFMLHKRHYEVWNII